MDRNIPQVSTLAAVAPSLSARRAWIEISIVNVAAGQNVVALRKESVDRNNIYIAAFIDVPRSLSARRAWIEIVLRPDRRVHGFGRSPQGERG